ncbi:hypothetical protein A2U01_0039179, partial [Trifolium medium]|nr:hypothetical protein [Trifolium medium]
SHILLFFREYTKVNGDRYGVGEGNSPKHIFESRKTFLSFQRYGSTPRPRYSIIKWPDLGSSEEDNRT